MKRCIPFLTFLCFLMLFGLPLTSMAQDSEMQTVVDPLTVSGSVGTQITSSWNNADLHYNSPFSAIAYANMTVNAYGISIPMSINFVNVNSKQFSFSDPSFMINFRPMWKKFTFYFGTAAMNFSNYTYSGISFDGVGMEYKGKKFRFGGFYGNFNHATTFRTELDDRDAIQFLSDSLLGLNNVAYTTFHRALQNAFPNAGIKGCCKAQARYRELERICQKNPKSPCSLSHEKQVVAKLKVLALDVYFKPYKDKENENEESEFDL